MKIYVVNLKSSQKRRKRMQEQLEKLNLDFEIFDAVDGKDLTKDNIAMYFDMKYYNNRRDYYSLGMAGCTLSHYFLYKKIVEEKVDKALILEDDMVINKSFINVLPNLSEQLRRDEVIMLFYQSRSPIEISFSSKIGSEKLKYELYQVNELKGLASTGGYLISFDTAKKLADGLCPLSTGPDDWKIFFNRNFINGIRVVYPFIFRNSYEQTTINPKFEKLSLLASLLVLIENHKIFPFYQMLRYRRKRNIAKMQNCKIMEEESVDYRK